MNIKNNNSNIIGGNLSTANVDLDIVRVIPSVSSVSNLVPLLDDVLKNALLGNGTSINPYVILTDN